MCDRIWKKQSRQNRSHTQKWSEEGNNWVVKDNQGKLMVTWMGNDEKVHHQEEVMYVRSDLEKTIQAKIDRIHKNGMRKETIGL